MSRPRLDCIALLVAYASRQSANLSEQLAIVRRKAKDPAGEVEASSVAAAAGTKTHGVLAW